jgi:hypothetical protein
LKGELPANCNKNNELTKKDIALPLIINTKIQDQKLRQEKKR